MPLNNKVISKLNEITFLVEDKNSLKGLEVEKIKNIFVEILHDGENYDVDDIEKWFKMEGSWNDKKSIVRITNISHYIQAKYEQIKQFKILQNDDSHSCN